MNISNRSSPSKQLMLGDSDSDSPSAIKMPKAPIEEITPWIMVRISENRRDGSKKKHIKTKRLINQINNLEEFGGQYVTA